MTLDNFWNIIELTWKDYPELDAIRQEVIKTNEEDELFHLSNELCDSMLEGYRKRVGALSKEEMTSYIQHFEERMYHIDRQEIHEYTDGSDDGFLYCRCFIVAMGKAYYTMIDEDPSKATADVEAEIFGFEGYNIYKAVFNEEFDIYQYHSMETCSNTEHWND